MANLRFTWFLCLYRLYFLLAFCYEQCNFKLIEYCSYIVCIWYLYFVCQYCKFGCQHQFKRLPGDCLWNDLCQVRPQTLHSHCFSYYFVCISFSEFVLCIWLSYDKKFFYLLTCSLILSAVLWQLTLHEQYNNVFLTKVLSAPAGSNKGDSCLWPGD